MNKLLKAIKDKWDSFCYSVLIDVYKKRREKYGNEMHYRPLCKVGEQVIFSTLDSVDLIGPGPRMVVTMVNNAENYMLFANKAFTKIPVYIQEAALCHEMGHIEFGHLLKASGGDNPLVAFDNIDFEIEADNYAISKGHSKGLIDLLEIHVKHLGPHPNLIKRLENLKQLK